MFRFGRENANSSTLFHFGISSQRGKMRIWNSECSMLSFLLAELHYRSFQWNCFYILFLQIKLDIHTWLLLCVFLNRWWDIAIYSLRKLVWPILIVFEKNCVCHCLISLMSDLCLKIQILIKLLYTWMFSCAGGTKYGRLHLPLWVSFHQIQVCIFVHY